VHEESVFFILAAKSWLISEKYVLNILVLLILVDSVILSPTSLIK